MSPEGIADFQRQQAAFSAYIRNPAGKPAPDGISSQRMDLYSELFFNNFNAQLTTNFPVLHQLMPDHDWDLLVRDFIINHRCRTPLFTEFGAEFIDYLQNTRQPKRTDWPFLLELAHYEYVELAVEISVEETDHSAIDANGDLLSNHPVVAPTAWNLTYRFDVQNIGPGYLPDHPPEQPTQLVVYRDRHDMVHFLEINHVTQRMITLLKENPQYTGLDVLKQIASELNHSQPEQVIEAGRNLLEDLRQRNVLLGTVNP